MKTKTTLVLFFFLQAFSLMPCIAAEWRCPENTYLCTSSINLCCPSPKCDPNPLSFTCPNEDPHLSPLLGGASNNIQAVNDAPLTAENFHSVLKSNVVDNIRIHNLQQCLQSALNLSDELPALLTSFQQNSVRSVPALFAELSKVSTLNIHHPDCKDSIFDILALKRLFEKPELSRPHLLSAQRSNYLLNQISNLKLNYFNTAKAYGSVIGDAFKEYLKTTQNEPVITQEYVDYLNTVQTSWVAKLNPRVENLTRQGLKNLVGWGSLTQSTNKSSKTPLLTRAASSFPANFRVNEQWPNCESPIYNQEHCDGCWAFSAAGILSDRLCIASGGKVKVPLSAQYVIDCDSRGGNCGGGSMEAAWWFLGFIGTTTEACIPFKSQDGTYRPCGGDRVCVNGENKPLYYAVEDKTVALNSKELMKQELMENGSIQSGFQIYDDFMVYSSGIYVPVSTKKPLGAHAVRIVGWGTTNGTEYWIVANSFGTKWGMEGYCNFKMDQLDIEKVGMVGYADPDRTEESQMTSFLANPFEFEMLMS